MVKKLLLIIACSLFIAPGLLQAEVAKGDWAVGLNYPGLGVRYFLADGTSLEVKGQVANNVGVFGLRGYYYFNPKDKIVYFSGLEADYTIFDYKDSKGKGFAGEIFAGCEYFFTKSFSFQADLGPAIISVKDDDTSESASGLEFVVNFGINYYFGRRGEGK